MTNGREWTKAEVMAELRSDLDQVLADVAAGRVTALAVVTRGRDGRVRSTLAGLRPQVSAMLVEASLQALEAPAETPPSGRGPA